MTKNLIDQVRALVDVARHASEEGIELACDECAPGPCSATDCTVYRGRVALRDLTFPALEAALTPKPRLQLYGEALDILDLCAVGVLDNLRQVVPVKDWAKIPPGAILYVMGASKFMGDAAIGCRPEGREMLRTPAGQELVREAAKQIMGATARHDDPDNGSHGIRKSEEASHAPLAARPKSWRQQLQELGGWDNELVNVPAGAVRKIIEELERAQAAGPKQHWYRHYGGDVYEFITMAKLESDPQLIMMVYSKPGELPWIRPVTEFAANFKKINESGGVESTHAGAIDDTAENLSSHPQSEAGVAPSPLSPEDPEIKVTRQTIRPQ